MDWLSSLFLGAFVFGLVFCLAGMLLGLGDAGHGHFPLHLHGNQGSGGASAIHGADTGHGSAHVSPWNSIGLTAFVAWFGGVGYLALAGWQLAAWTSLLLAAAAGLAAWWLVFLFFRRVLAKGERLLDPDEYRLEVTVARVTVPIAAGRTGEIQYSKTGVRRSDGARSVDHAEIAHGEEVVIVRYERGIAYVQPWRTFVEDGAPRRR
jgi:membrane protein implicated in regulation of membrane protease activity